MPNFPPNVEEEISRYQQGLVLQSSDLSLGAITSMVNKETIDISPTFQRRDRWKATAQSRLIESFLLNIPVPPVYLSEDPEGTYAVIDGKQRITAIHLFMTHKLTLTGLQMLTKLNGLKCRDFPKSITNSLEVRPYVRTVTLLRQSGERVRYEVFLRLNIAGVPLSPMEIRRVAYRGEYCDMVFTEAENDFLRDRLKIHSNQSPAYQKMVDAEFVLRFLTLRDRWENFGGDYRAAMDEHMEQHAHADTTMEHSDRFKRTMHYCERLWGLHAFQRPADSGWRNQTLAGVYDAQTIAVDLLDGNTLEAACSRPDDLLQKTEQLFNEDDQFLEAVTIATNNRARVVYRIERIRDLLVQLAQS